MDPEQLFLDHLALIDRIARTTGRRRHLLPQEIDDLCSFVHLHLIENDYGILRKFQQRSTFFTYLSTVIERLSIDFCVEAWGRWRPSAAADRLGPDAVLLERLVTRDGHGLDEAIEIARTNHGIGLAEGAFRTLWEQLPVRSQPIEVSDEGAADVAGPATADSAVTLAADVADVDRLERALKAALDRRSDHDRVLLGLRFSEGLGVQAIAGVMHSSPATVHRRLSRLLAELREELSRAGITGTEVARLADGAVSVAPLLRVVAERLSKPVRLFNRDG